MAISEPVTCSYVVWLTNARLHFRFRAKKTFPHTECIIIIFVSPMIFEFEMFVIGNLWHSSVLMEYPDGCWWRA